MQSTLNQILGHATGQRGQGGAPLPSVDIAQPSSNTGKVEIFSDVFVELSKPAPKLQTPNAAQTEPVLGDDPKPELSGDEVSTPAHVSNAVPSAPDSKVEKPKLELAQSVTPTIRKTVLNASFQAPDDGEPVKVEADHLVRDVTQKPEAMDRPDDRPHTRYRPPSDLPEQPVVVQNANATAPDRRIVVPNALIEETVIRPNNATPPQFVSTQPELNLLQRQPPGAKPQPDQRIDTDPAFGIAKNEGSLNAPPKTSSGTVPALAQAPVPPELQTGKPLPHQAPEKPSVTQSIAARTVPDAIPRQINTDGPATGLVPTTASQTHQVNAPHRIRTDHTSLTDPTSAKVQPNLIVPSQTIAKTIQPVLNGIAVPKLEPQTVRVPASEAEISHPTHDIMPNQRDRQPTTTAHLTARVDLPKPTVATTTTAAPTAATIVSEPNKGHPATHDATKPSVTRNVDPAPLVQPTRRLTAPTIAIEEPVKQPRSRESQNVVRPKTDTPFTQNSRLSTQQIVSSPDQKNKDQPVAINADLSQKAAPQPLLQRIEGQAYSDNEQPRLTPRSTSDTTAPIVKPIQSQASAFQAGPTAPRNLETPKQIVAQEFSLLRGLTPNSQQSSLIQHSNMEPGQALSAPGLMRANPSIPMPERQVTQFPTVQPSALQQPKTDRILHAPTEPLVVEPTRQTSSPADQPQVVIPNTAQRGTSFISTTPDRSRRLDRADATPPSTPSSSQLAPPQAGLFQPLPTQPILQKVAEQENGRTAGQSTLSDAALSLKSDGVTAPTPYAQSATTRMELPAHVARQMLDVVQHLPNKPVEISLNPEELGKLRLSVSTSDTGLIISVVAERPETLDLLRRHIAILGQEFEGMGYKDVSFTFNGDSPTGSQSDDQSATFAQGDAPLNETAQLNPDTLKPTTQNGLDLRL